MFEFSPSSTGQPTPPPTASGGSPSQALDSRELFAQRRQVLIRHGSDTYVLRLTRQGKLILTK